MFFMSCSSKTAYILYSCTVQHSVGSIEKCQHNLFSVFNLKKKIQQTCLTRHIWTLGQDPLASLFNILVMASFFNVQGSPLDSYRTAAQCATLANVSSMILLHVYTDIMLKLHSM